MHTFEQIKNSKWWWHESDLVKMPHKKSTSHSNSNICPPHPPGQNTSQDVFYFIIMACQMKFLFCYACIVCTRTQTLSHMGSMTIPCQLQRCLFIYNLSGFCGFWVARKLCFDMALRGSGETARDELFKCTSVGKWNFDEGSRCLLFSCNGDDGTCHSFIKLS